MAKRIHLVGIGGVGMAGLAVLLKHRGHDVSGCEIADSPRVRWLRELGVPVAVGHDAAHAANADVVIATPAVPKENPELAAAIASGKLRWRGEALAAIVSGGSSVAVCGSHGKTTTATFAAKLLSKLGERVEWAIGGETGDFPVAGRDRSGEPSVLVVEADESDGTLAQYRATTLVVTNCEYDHPDHFRTVADYRACYDAARRQAGSVIESQALGVPDWLAALPSFAALAPHNRQNARAAVEVALLRGHAPEAIAAALPEAVSRLPDRRFEKIAAGVYTDYAHHPTEMACAVGMARAACRGKLRVLFQPHRHSRTKALCGMFAPAFDGADEVILCPTYAAFERPVEGGDVADLYAACRAQERPGPSRYRLARSCAEAWHHARRTMLPGDVTLLLGAGDIIALRDAVVSGTLPPKRRVWIGAGTNTWQSDLETDEDFVKTPHPAGMPGAAFLKAHPGLAPWMAGIPGTVGGWVKMNAGAFGHSFSEVLAAVKVDGSWIDAANCGFGYRTSSITGEIQDVRVASDGSGAGSRQTEESYLSRRKKFPPGTKGSVFKNPSGDFAGRLLDEAGCRGLRVGGAFVWAEHANVIVSGPGATPSDFLALARIMRNRVFFRTGIALEPEVRGILV